ncbi:NUDIX hydrolase [Oceanibium sediminis]|uniref:NUDIX hydrolase n=1 Tax=Oceanibium sediminis TaxID=2026339 RepID=UPI000DD2DBC5|nr:NUDIX hydrolase [Oceanibium sediminis]
MSPQSAPEVRDASTVILLREMAEGPHVLMGQRGSKAVFMPDKYVFPGGRVDPEDHDIPLGTPLPAELEARMNASSPRIAEALAVAAVRELWEETGLRLGVPGAPPAVVPDSWGGFLDAGLLPHAGALQMMFRAVTPVGRPRRFDARFFMVRADEVTGDLDDFSAADDELRHLHWLPLAQARQLDLPFITRVVLSELAARLRAPDVPRAVPFFDHSTGSARFLSL